MTSRHGFALVTILWIVTLLSVVVAAADVVAHSALAAEFNRRSLVRSTWQLQGCAAWLTSHVEVDDSLWTDLQRVVLASHGDDCEVSLEPDAVGVDLTVPDSALILRVLLAAGTPRATADSMAAALLDWIDQDDVPRAAGAEREWYRDHGMAPPANRPVFDRAELELVRGFATRPELTRLFSPRGGRISLVHAPAPVLRSMPGVTDETAVEIVRARGSHAPDWPRVSALLTRTSRDSLARASDWLTRHTVWSPDAWFVTLRSREGPSAPAAELRLRLVRVGRRLVSTERVITW